MENLKQENKKQEHNWTREDDVIALSEYLSTLEGTSWANADVRGTKYINRRSKLDGVLGLNSINKKMQHNQYLDTEGKEGLKNISVLNEQVFRQFRYDADKLQKLLEKIEDRLTRKEKNTEKK